MANGFAIAGTTQLLDVHSDNWSLDALNHFGLPPSWFSKPVKSGAKLGPVRGLPALAKTKVIAVPGHDTTCAYDAMPADPSGNDIFLSSGTWALVGFENNPPVLGAEARVANDRTGRGGFRPLVNVIGLWLLEGILIEFASRPTNDRQWRSLIKAAAALPPTRLLDITDPAFSNPASMRAAIDAQLKQHRTPRPPDLTGYVRLICASLGQGHADVIRRFERLANRSFPRILMVGGGSKKRLALPGYR